MNKVVTRELMWRCSALYIVGRRGKGKLSARREARGARVCMQKIDGCGENGTPQRGGET